MSGPAPAPAREASEDEDAQAWARDLPWRERLRRSEVAGELWVGLGLLLAYAAVGFAALVRFQDGLGSLDVHPEWIDPRISLGPSWAHPFGVITVAGVDELSALFQATPWDLAIVGSVLAAGLSLGFLLGGVAGLEDEGIVDLLVTSWSDLIAGVPPFVLVTILFLGVEPFLAPAHRLPAFVIGYVAVLWPYYARPVRARARVVREAAFVEAARAAGASRGLLLRRHVLGNSLAPALAQIPVDVGNLFFLLSAFPFLACFGASASTERGVSVYSTGPYGLVTPLPSLPFPEWGYLLARGACSGWAVQWSANSWWMYAFPAVVIVLFGFAVALTCDGVQKMLARHSGI
ncbi:MAG: ABC transporter permease subunit [Thermoplasmata archaeon]|nr:ABC transporter permease subunit [Thermoplasmata archaeon]